MDIVPLFKALADEKRLRIAALISTRGLAVQEIAAAVELAPATVSHHLGVMRAAGLVEATHEQYYTIYRFRQQPLLDALRALTQRQAEPEEARDLAKYDQKVLRDYLENGKLTTIPAQRKKRDAILRYLAGQFEVGRTYSEKEVNQILVTYHDDVATLRRELVAGPARLLARENGRYWRLDPVPA
jgi:hypothetical protein